MTHDQFWQIIGNTCRSDPRRSDEWDRRLTEALTQLPPEEIVAWNHIFDRLVAAASTIDLMAACYLINGGAGDDGFYYFRCWLVGMGKEVYSAAIVEADSLANVVSSRWFSEGIDAEAEIYAAAHRAWMQVTGQPDTAEYPARNESAELVGEDWDFDDPDSMRKHLPRLVSLYGQ